MKMRPSTVLMSDGGAADMLERPPRTALASTTLRLMWINAKSGLVRDTGRG